MSLVMCDANNNMIHREKLLEGVEHYFCLLRWQNGDRDNDSEMQHYLVIHEGCFFILPGHNNIPTGVIFREVVT